MTSQTRSILRLTVRRELDFPSSGVASWVARDSAGHWRNYCGEQFSKDGSAAAAAAAMFHCQEVQSVSGSGPVAVVSVYQ